MSSSLSLSCADLHANLLAIQTANELYWSQPQEAGSTSNRFEGLELDSFNSNQLSCTSFNLAGRWNAFLTYLGMSQDRDSAVERLIRATHEMLHKAHRSVQEDANVFKKFIIARCIKDADPQALDKAVSDLEETYCSTVPFLDAVKDASNTALLLFFKQAFCLECFTGISELKEIHALNVLRSVVNCDPPFRVLADLACGREVETPDLRKWISTLMDANVTIDVLHTALMAFVEIIRTNTIYENASLGSLEEAIFDLSKEIGVSRKLRTPSLFVQKDPKFTAWREALKPGDMLTLKQDCRKEKSFLSVTEIILGDRLKNKERGSFNNNLYFSVKRLTTFWIPLDPNFKKIKDLIEIAGNAHLSEVPDLKRWEFKTLSGDSGLVSLSDDKFPSLIYNKNHRRELDAEQFIIWIPYNQAAIGLKQTVGTKEPYCSSIWKTVGLSDDCIDPAGRFALVPKLNKMVPTAEFREALAKQWVSEFIKMQRCLHLPPDPKYIMVNSSHKLFTLKNLSVFLKNTRAFQFVPFDYLKWEQFIYTMALEEEKFSESVDEALIEGQSTYEYLTTENIVSDNKAFKLMMENSGMYGIDESKFYAKAASSAFHKDRGELDREVDCGHILNRKAALNQGMELQEKLLALKKQCVKKLKIANTAQDRIQKLEKLIVEAHAKTGARSILWPSLEENVIQGYLAL